MGLDFKIGIVFLFFFIFQINLSRAQCDFLLIKKNNLFGYIDIYGNTIFTPQFEEAWEFIGGRAAVKINGKYGLINCKGEIILSPNYDDIFFLDHNFLLVKKRDSIGYVNSRNEMISLTPEPKSIGLRVIEDDRIIYSINGKYGLVDTTGRIIIKPKFDRLWNYGEGYMIADIYSQKDSIVIIKNNVRFATKNHDTIALQDLDCKAQVIYPRNVEHLVDKNGNVITKLPPLLNVGAFHQGLCYISDSNNIYGYMNTRGQLVVDYKYNHATDFSEGLAAVAIDLEDVFETRTGRNTCNMDTFQYREWKSLYGYINRNGEVAIPLQFEKASDFKQGLAIVMQNGKYGVINQSGKFIIEPKYEETRWFSEGLLGVKLNDKWGFVDTLGSLVIENKFDEVKQFADGYCQVSINGKWGFINRKGEWILKPSFDEILYVFPKLKIIGFLEGKHNRNYFWIGAQFFLENDRIIKLGYINFSKKVIWEATN